MRNKVEIEVFKAGKRIKKSDEVVAEELLKVYVNGKEFISILCSPENLEYLILGFLFSEGFIKNITEVKSLKIENGCGHLELREDVLLTHKQWIRSSGCGNLFSTAPKIEEIKAPFFTLSPEKILYLIKELENLSVNFQRTGGVHASALSDREEIILFHEDIGRHNAVDKIIGEAMSKGISTSDKILLTSGRISSEMVSKIARVNIPIVISRSAPTALGIKFAEFYGITLIGFARGKRFNLYTHRERIGE
ncbi:MAG: formate dehydrogenase accessory sulfurtransferase FdhD [Caldiserica bacterium]|nr:formate dehydrogenase accessory sulfurtransferase FdhD [Caldisericota bacterium]